MNKHKIIGWALIALSVVFLFVAFFGTELSYALAGALYMIIGLGFAILCPWAGVLLIKNNSETKED